MFCSNFNDGIVSYITIRKEDISLTHRENMCVAGCEALRTFSPRATEKDSVILINLEEHFGTIAGVVCGTLGLLLAIFIFLLLRYVNVKQKQSCSIMWQSYV